MHEPPPRMQIGFIHRNHILVTVKSGMVTHFSEALIEQPKKTIAALCVVESILVAEIQQVHHQMLNNGSITVCFSDRCCIQLIHKVILQIHHARWPWCI